MHLTPADTEKLLLAVAGMVARDRHERGVLLNALSATRLRALTHLDAPLADCRRAGTILLEILGA